MEVSETVRHALPYVVVVNLTLVAAALVVIGRLLARGPLTEGVPGPRQNFAEYATSYFYRKAKEMGDMRVVRVVAPFLGTFFFLILLSNFVVVVPLPVLGTPPTAFFGVTLGLALSSVLGTFVIAAALNGPKASIKHLFWPNPLQLISEFTDVLSLSLRLFGNIGGEYMTLVLVAAVVPVGIPLILHLLGLIPAFVQALVFTLLTTSFVAAAVHHEEKATKEVAAGVVAESLPAMEDAGSGLGVRRWEEGVT